jgi:hypothetical protein
MLDRLKKSIQISCISAILLTPIVLNLAPAQASDSSQLLGGNLTWQCNLSPAMKSPIRSSENEADRILPCETKQERVAKAIATANPAAVNQLIQQGLQLLQTAQPLILQFLQPLGPSAPQLEQQSP